MPDIRLVVHDLSIGRQVATVCEHAALLAAEQISLVEEAVQRAVEVGRVRFKIQRYAERVLKQRLNSCYITE